MRFKQRGLQFNDTGLDAKAIGMRRGQPMFRREGNDLPAITNAVAFGTAMTAPLSLDLLYRWNGPSPTPSDKGTAEGVFCQ